MSKRTAESFKAINEAWKRERELVLQGKGTRDWTEQQQKDIKEKGKAYDDNGLAFEGQHMKSVTTYPEFQGNPDNIQFLTREEHFKAHGENWQNPTNGYYDYKTGKMIEFNDELKPCEIIELTEPIYAEKTIKKESFKLDLEKIKEKLEEIDNEKSKKINNDLGKAVEISFEFGAKVFKRIVKLPVDVAKFVYEHPKILDIIEGSCEGVIKVGEYIEKRQCSKEKLNESLICSIEDDNITGNSLNIESVIQNKNDNMNAKEIKINNISNNITDMIKENIHSNDLSNTTKKEYTSNDVPAGKQRYHYKDGTVKERPRAKYSRGYEKNN